MQILKINPFTPKYKNRSQNVYYPKITQYPYDSISFSGKKDKNGRYCLALAEAKKINLFKSGNGWSHAELERVEGLQSGLKIFDNMDMHQIFFLLSAIDEKRVSFPIVRGCYHNCSYCFLDAKAPVVRLSYEDFFDTLNCISKIAKRMNYKFTNHYDEDCTLFYDSDGSEIYLRDKKNNIHEYPELNKLTYEIFKKPGSFDTAGWNPNKKEIQERMERLVKYYSSDKHLKEVDQICISLNPFEGIYTQAIKQKRRGNIDNYNYLKGKYIDMAVNTMHTFAPLIDKDKFGIICRAYPDMTPGEEYDGFRESDMENLRTEIFDAYLDKYSDELDEDPELYEKLVGAFWVSSIGISASGRDNQFKDYIFERVLIADMDQYSDFYFDLEAANKSALIFDTDGTVYTGNDYELCKTDIKLNFKNPVPKPIKPTPYHKIAKYKNEGI